MNPKTLALVFLAALPCALGAHLAAILLFAAAVVIAGIHLLPVLVPVGVVGTVLFLMTLIAVTVRATGWGCSPMRRASS